MVLTLEQKLASGNVPSSAVFCHTLINTGVLGAKIWNFQNTSGVVDFYLARERISISSSPWNGRHGAAEVTHKRSRGLISCNSTCVSGHKSDHEEWAARLHRVLSPRTYFPKAKHSSFTDDPLETRRASGNCTSILGSYSPITAAWRIKDKANQSKRPAWTRSVPNLIMKVMQSCRSWHGAGTEQACVWCTSAFGLTDGWVWITFLPQLKSEGWRRSARDWVYYVWQAPCCAGACMHFCQQGRRLCSCEYVPSCR